jgi:hypothetical protein
VACCGYQILVGHKTLKHPFTVGDGVLAKLKCVIHAPLLSVLSLRKRDRGPVQGDNNDEHDSLLHRGPSLRSTAMSTSPEVIQGPRGYGSPRTEPIGAAHVAWGQPRRGLIELPHPAWVADGCGLLLCVRNGMVSNSANCFGWTNFQYADRGGKQKRPRTYRCTAVNG